MILLLGARGYIGQAFDLALTQRKLKFLGVSRGDVDYTNFEKLLTLIKNHKPDLVINAAGYTGKPNVDACETQKTETLHGNSLFPATVAHACAAAMVPWGHVSSGCIYTGAKLIRNGVQEIVRDLTEPAVKSLVDRQRSIFSGFTEEDEPNFSFRKPPCSFYSGTKALGEEAIAGVGESYVWRLRIPFDEVDNSRNYLSKLQRYPKVYENVNSISHRADFVNACLDLWISRAPFGIYNVTNTGWITTREVVTLIRARLKLDRDFEFWESDAEFYKVAAKAPRSNCIMDNSKLLKAGVKMRPVSEALEASLTRWRPE